MIQARKLIDDKLKVSIYETSLQMGAGAAKDVDEKIE